VWALSISRTPQLFACLAKLPLSNGGTRSAINFSGIDSLAFNGGGGADSFTISNPTGILFAPTVGVSCTDTGSASLALQGGYSASNITNNYTDAHSGNVNVDGSVITCSGLSQTVGILDRLAAATETFNFASTSSNNITLGDDATPNNGLSQISSTATSPTTTFANPATGLTVNLGNARDTITAGPLDASNPPPTINLDGGTGSDTFDVAPSTASTFNIDGNLPNPPASPGDTLNATLPAGSNPILTSTATPTGFTGNYSFLAGGYQPVNFSRIETLNPSDVTLTITKDDGDTSEGEIPGTPVTYTIVARNTGSLGVSGVTISDVFPSSSPPSTAPGFTSDSYTSSATGGATGNTASGTGNINDTVTLPAGSSITCTATGLINPSSLGSLSNTATLTPPSGVTGSPQSSTDSDPLTPQANLGVNLTATPDPVGEGNNLTYTITISNSGPSDAQNVNLTDTLPAGTTFVSQTQISGPIFALSNPGGGGTGTISDSIATLAAGASATFTLVVNVGEIDGSSIANTASVSSSTSDPASANNTITTTTSSPEPAIVLTGGMTLSTAAFSSLSNVTLATFTHANGVEPASDFSTTVNWGDGTSSSATVVQSGGTYSVIGSHTYIHPGHYAITVTVSEDGVSTSASSTAAISPAPLPAGVASNSLSNYINQTLGDVFKQQPTAAQIKSIEQSMLLLDFEVAGELATQGIAPATAFLEAYALGELDFNVWLGLLSSRGQDLNTTVNDLVELFLLETAIQAANNNAG
jgi:uncharacterized repeat protein (TIGR01451 family)